jgi:hypothetical protein
MILAVDVYLPVLPVPLRASISMPGALARRRSGGQERLSSGASNTWNRTRVAQGALRQSKCAGSGLFVHNSGSKEVDLSMQSSGREPFTVRESGYDRGRARPIWGGGLRGDEVGSRRCHSLGQTRSDRQATRDQL